MRFEHTGSVLPFKFYYKDNQNLKFSTAGPLRTQIEDIGYPLYTDFRLKFSLTNMGEILTTENVDLGILPADTSILSIGASIISFGDIEPGATKIYGGYVYIDVDESFDGTIDFDFNIYSNDYLYWHDSLRGILVNVENSDNKKLPSQYVLEQNYPNPFNSTTTIVYSIPKLSFVILNIFNILGRKVVTLVNEEKSTGTYKILFDASIVLGDLSSGIYYYQLYVDEIIKTRRMIILK